MVKAIVGANWGDEGKGKITDVLAQNSDVVIRFQGGANAGHTIVNEYGKFALHQLPSGVFNSNVTNIIGNGVAFSVENFVKEMNEEHFADDPIYYGGALNYGRGKIENVAKRMQQKVDAGCSYFLTQPIYSDEDIERIRMLKSMVDTKILCGIMPLVSYRNANFIKNEMSGINVPDEIVERYTPDMTKEEAEVVGAQIASEIIEKLSEFADGYYFMLPFNRVSLMDKIIIK